MCLNLTLTVSPEVIILGGGVMNREILYDIIRSEFKNLLKDYIKHPKFESKINIIFKNTILDLE